MKQTVAAAVLLVCAAGSIGVAAQIRARPRADASPLRVVYRPTGSAVSAMNAEAAALALKAALMQMGMEHQGDPIVDVQVHDGTLAEVIRRLKDAGNDPDKDRIFGATGPRGDQARGVLILRTGKKWDSTVIAVNALAPVVVALDGMTIVSGSGNDVDRTTAIGYLRKGVADEALLRRAADALVVVRLAGGLQGEVAYQGEFDRAVVAYRAAATKPAVPEAARRFQVQASAAVRARDFQTAIDRYGDGLRAFPAWPDAHFDLALQLGAARAFAEAIVEMSRFLALVPDSPDARKAQDQIYEWEAQPTGDAAIPFIQKKARGRR